MNITEEILSAHSQRNEVHPGQFIQAKLDFIIANDITAPLAIDEFESLGSGQIFDTERVAFVLDHFTPNKDIASAQQCKKVRDFARRFKLKYFFEGGRGGIEHALIPEKGLALPGEVIIGADSHTCTYGALGAFATGVGSTDVAGAMLTGEVWLKVPETTKFIYNGKLNPWVSGKDLILYTIGDIGVNGAYYQAMELAGEAISSLSMDSRLTMCNMAVEAGAKSAIIEPDSITMKYIDSLPAARKPRVFKSSPDAHYLDTKEYDCTRIKPQLALPPSPGKVKAVDEIGNVTIDQVVIGSCTNGRIEDLRTAARILKGRSVHPYVRAIIIPATQKIYADAVREGLIEAFIRSGAMVSTPTCGPCIGGHMGVLAEGERAVSTTNRNFTGRMGHIKSEVYLAGPAVAAASANNAQITRPEEILN